MKVTWFDRRLKVRPRLLFERAVRRRPGAGLGLGSSWSPGCPFYRRWRRPMALGTAEGSGPSRLVPRGPEGASVRENIPNQLCRVPGPATSALYGTGVSTDGAAWLSRVQAPCDGSKRFATDTSSLRRGSCSNPHPASPPCIAPCFFILFELFQSCCVSLPPFPRAGGMPGSRARPLPGRRGLPNFCFFSARRKE